MPPNNVRVTLHNRGPITIFNNYKPDYVDEIRVSDDRTKKLSMCSLIDRYTEFEFCRDLYEYIKNHVPGYHVQEKVGPTRNIKKKINNTWQFHVVSNTNATLINIKVMHVEIKNKGKEFVITLTRMDGDNTEFKELCEILKKYLLPTLSQGGRRKPCTRRKRMHRKHRKRSHRKTKSHYLRK
jgi:hypothetical protein